MMGDAETLGGEASRPGIVIGGDAKLEAGGFELAEQRLECDHRHCGVRRMLGAEIVDERQPLGFLGRRQPGLPGP